MQLESSDESLACWVALHSTPSSGIPATAERRDILSAANGSAAVEDNADTGVITTWPAASASDVCDGSAFRLAHGDCRFRRRGQPLSCIDCARGPAFSRGLVRVVSGVERSGWNGLRPNRRRAFRGWDREHVNQCVSRSSN
jgi:hypothetical protein